MPNFYEDFCPQQSPEVRAAEKKLQELGLRIRCLKNQIERSDYADFDALYAEMERLHQEWERASSEANRACARLSQHYFEAY